MSEKVKDINSEVQVREYESLNPDGSGIAVKLYFVEKIIRKDGKIIGADESQADYTSIEEAEKAYKNNSVKWLRNKK